MSNEALMLYNLFMLVCYGFIVFTFGRIYESNQQMKQQRQRHTEAMIQAYRSRRA